MTHRYGAALLHLGLMLLLVACGGGPAPSDVPENVAAQDAAWLEARQAALRGEAAGAAPATTDTDTTPLPTSPPVTGTPLPPADLTRLAETAISEATVLDEATTPPTP